MRDLTKMPRRGFLTGTGSMLTAGLATSSISNALFAQQPATESDSNEFVLKSQPLPEPKIILPTDSLPADDRSTKRVAAITTAYWKYSHADDIITKFIEGYSVVGRIHRPRCKVVSLYIDQFPKNDIGRGMAARYNIPLYKTPTEALTAGGKDLAVDAVLLIGEHGDYPFNEKGQHLYPRHRLFKEIVEVFRRSGRSVPVFNDKHLSYSWKKAEWMYQQSHELKFPLMAGSSVPVSWRRPPLSFRPGIQLDAALAAGSGSFESYGFHNLELLQTFVEKRQGGEVGVKSVQAIEGDDVMKADDAGRWPADLVPAAMASAPASSKRKFTKAALAKSVIFQIEYSDGFEAAVCLNGRLLQEFSFAAKVKGRAEPVATYSYLPKPQRDHFSFLCNHIEVMFRSGRPSYPVERTLLVTGILDALHDSRFAGGKRIMTPHLQNLRYTPAHELVVGG